VADSETEQQEAGHNFLSASPGSGETERPKLGLGTDGWWRQVSVRAVALLMAAGVLAGFWFLRRPLALLLLGIVVAEALEPLVGRLDRRLPRLVAVLAVYAFLIAAFAGIMSLVLPNFLHQARQLIRSMPDLIPRLQEWATSSLPFGRRLSDMLPGVMSSLGANALRFPMAIADSLLEFVLVFVVSIYWLILLPKTSQFALSLVPAQRQPRFAALARDIRCAMGGYFRGTAIIGLVLGVTAYIGLMLLGVRFPLVLSLFTAVMEFIPVVGATISVTLIVLVAFLQAPSLGLIALAFGIAFHQIENHVLVPNVMHSQTNISPLLAVIAVFTGATLGGVLGALVAVPLAAALQVLVVKVVAPSVRHATGAPAVLATGEREDGPSVPPA
jgi:predicted PurR-regulated permease PerM